MSKQAAATTTTTAVSTQGATTAGTPTHPHHVALTEGLQERNDIQKGGISIDYKHSAFVEYVKYMSGPAIVEAVNKTIFAPLERMKIIHQAQNALYINEKAKIKNIIQFITRVPREQGITALWRGNFANIMYIVPRTIAQFSFMENINSTFFPAGEKNISDTEYGVRKFAAAMASGFCTLLLAYPFDLAKTRLSLEFAKNKYDKIFTGILSVFGETRSKTGFSSLYRGFFLANVTNAPYFITIFSSFQALKIIKESEDATAMEVFRYLAPASIAGLLATWAVYPLDTVKRRFQMNGYNGNLMYKGSMDVLRKTIQKEGFFGLYSGLSVTTVKFLGSAAIHSSLVAAYATFKSEHTIF